MMNPLLADAAARADRYLATLDARGVAPRPEAIAALRRQPELEVVALQDIHRPWGS